MTDAIETEYSGDLDKTWSDCYHPQFTEIFKLFSLMAISLLMAIILEEEFVFLKTED